MWFPFFAIAQEQRILIFSWEKNHFVIFYDEIYYLKEIMSDSFWGKYIQKSH